MKALQWITFMQVALLLLKAIITELSWLVVMTPTYLLYSIFIALICYSRITGQTLEEIVESLNDEI